MMNCADKTDYSEFKIDKTLYRVISVYKGEVELAKAMEDQIIRKLLRDDDGDD